MKFKDTKFVQATKNAASKSWEVTKAAGRLVRDHPKTTALALFTAYKVLTPDGAKAQTTDSTLSSAKENTAIVREMNATVDYNKMLDTAAREKIPSFKAGGHVGMVQVTTPEAGIQNFTPLGLNAQWAMSSTSSIEIVCSSLWEGSQNAKLPRGKDVATTETPRAQFEINYDYVPVETRTSKMEGKVALYGANNPHLAGISSTASNYGGRIVLSAYTRYIGPVGVGAKIDGGVEYSGSLTSYDMSVMPHIGVFRIGADPSGFFNGGSVLVGANIVINHGTAYGTYGYVLPYNDRLFYVVKAWAGLFGMLKASARGEIGTNHMAGQFDLTSFVEGREVTLGVQYFKDNTPATNLSMNGLKFTFSMTTGQ